MTGNRPVRILAITVRADFGGGPAHLLSLLSKIDTAGFQYFVACPNEKPYWDRFGSCVDGRLIEIPHRSFAPIRLLKLVRYVIENRIDVIHSHGKGAGLYGRALALLTGRPCVHTLHGVHVDLTSPLKRWLYLLYERLTSAAIAHLIYVSKSERDCASRLGLFRKVPHSIIENGVEIPEPQLIEAQRQLAREELFRGKQPFVVGTLSRFDFQKNMEEAFLIARRSPALVFLWIGDGEQRGALQERAALEGVGNIVFLGFTGRPGYYLSACDAYLSTSRWEGLPLGILEAMSLGLPVVASKVTGNVDAVQHEETGFLYQPGEIDEACSHLATLSGSEVTRSYLSRQARARCCREFNTKKMVAETSAIYAALLRRKSLR